MIMSLYYRMRRKACALLKDHAGVELWSHRLASPSCLAALRKGFDDSVFPAVIVEVCSDCNYRCPFCPQSSHRRPSQYMTLSSFEFLVQDLKRHHFNGVVVLTGNNEPLLHPLLLDFCRLVSDELPAAHAHFTTNGSLLGKDIILALSKIEHPPSLDVNDYTPKQTVTAKLEKLKEDLPEFEKLQLTLRKRSWDEVKGNRAGNQPGDQRRADRYRKIVCTWPFSGLFVTWDLKCVLCCSDYKHEVIMGDLATTSFMDVWKSNAYSQIRKSMMETQRADIPFCRKCDEEWFVLPDHCQPKKFLGSREE